MFLINVEFYMLVLRHLFHFQTFKEILRVNTDKSRNCTVSLLAE